VSGGRAKALARATIADRLPSFGGGWGRTVSGVSYYGELIGREVPGAWESAGGAPLLAALGIVDTERLARSSAESTRGVWPALNVDVWLRARLEEA
jgi:hypothetical protein